MGFPSPITRVVTWLALLSYANARVVTLPVENAADEQNKTSFNTALDARTLLPREADPTNFAWVRRLVAIGDSYTAGIGSGNQLGIIGTDDWTCSRYDYSYPELVYEALGQGIDNYDFMACSGDRSWQIYDQVMKMQSADMVIMTAGGNDLCLASMIKKCIMLPYDGEDSCNAVIDKAQENIDIILKPNLKQILMALNDKVNDRGIVVYNGYAQMFNTDNEDCAKQPWYFFKWVPSYWFKTPLQLTVARRKKFNDLVVQINRAISAVIEDVQDEVKYTVGFGDWDQWPYKGVAGQMCDPSSDGSYPDPKQPELQFFKPDSKIPDYIHDELKRDDTLARQDYEKHLDKNGIDKRIYDSLLWKSPNPGAVAKHKLDKREPAPPDCPGDGDFDATLGLGLPDTFGKLFHPNENCHETIASFAIAKAIDLRAKVLGVGSQTCELTDVFKCWKKEGRKGYATAYKMNENKDDFCNSVEQPDGVVGWKYEKTYFAGTPDEHSFKLQLSDEAKDWTKDECLESFDRVINSCDGNDPENPLNWKSGGSWRRGERTYEINIKRDNRPWPPIKATHGQCHGQYYGFHSGYNMKGAGFASWDYGQKTILPCMKGCLGLGVTGWTFDYFNAPDKDGNEWEAKYNTPIWTNARCFDNNKVVKCAENGFTDGCSGTG